MKKKAGRGNIIKWRRKRQVKESRRFRQVGGHAGAVKKRSFLRQLQSSETSIQDQRVGGQRGRDSEENPQRKESGGTERCRN